MNKPAGMQKIQTDIKAEEMSEHIDKVVGQRNVDEVTGGPVRALEAAIKEVHGNVAFIYGRFGDMVACRVLQQIIDSITSDTMTTAPEKKH